MEYFAFQWHITDECDQRCKHCYIFAEDTCKKPDVITWPQMQDTFYNFLDFCKVYHRLPHLYITGGDPILHPNFWDLLGLMKENKIPFTILGNPFHLNDEVCMRLKEYGCEKYQMSLDGRRQTHDWFRKPGSFDCTLEKIACIKRAGIRAVIMTTVSGTNIDEIPELIDIVVAHKADVFAFSRYCPTSEEKDVGIEPLRYRQLLADCGKKFKEYEAAGCETYFNKKDHLWTLYEYEAGEFHIPENAEQGMIYGGCNCGNGHLTILPTGDVYACRRVRNSKWNSQENRTPKYEILRSEQVFGEACAFDQRRQIMLVGGVASAAVVVGFNPAENKLADRLTFHARAVESVDNLFLQRCEKALHARVVETAMRPPHALSDGTKPGNHRSVLLAGVLAAVVGVQEQALFITIA